MYQISIDHKEQLAKIDARLMVRAHMLNAIPTDGGPIATWEVREYVTAMVGPLMAHMIDGTTGGLNGMLGNENHFISTQKGYINRGGSKYNTDPELAPRHWAFTPDGYERMRQDIPNFDELIQLAKDVMEHPELVDDATDQDADDRIHPDADDRIKQDVEYEGISSEEGQFPIRDADVATDQGADVQDIKEQIMDLLKRVDVQMKQIAEIFDRPLPSQDDQADKAPIQPKRVPYMQNR